jgi:nucleoid-associated protein YgaU
MEGGNHLIDRHQLEAENRTLYRLTTEAKVESLRCGNLQADSNIPVGNSWYTVQDGDYLSKIAERHHFPRAAYRAIKHYHNQQASKNAKVDRGRVEYIKTDNVIRPGWKIYMPSRAELAAYMEQGGEADYPRLPSANQ